MKLWGGRFTGEADAALEAYTHSLDIDHRLAKYDVRGSIAHAKTLVKAKVLTTREGARMVKALQALLKQAERGTIALDPSAEDVHSAVQILLEQKIGDVAGKLHTGRSRNDQVTLDMRLYCKEQVRFLDVLLRKMQRALVRQAKGHQETLIPGYTHLQRAQVVSVAHHFLAYVEMLQRDRDRLQDALKRIDVLPTGSSALAGTAVPLDRRYLARLLGLRKVSRNSMDAVSDRDYVIELMAAVAILGMHLSRLAEDWIVWCSQEFNLLELPDALATGSSAMPHKKNPDILELMRGSTGKLYGDLMAGLTVLKGLPMTYNRDLQWDKSSLFDACDTAYRSLIIAERLVAKVRINKQRARRLVEDPNLKATELAEYLVAKGMAFAASHRAVGSAVQLAESSERTIGDLTIDELQEISPLFTDEVFDLFDAHAAVAMKRTTGSTQPADVRRAIARWERAL